MKRNLLFAALASVAFAGCVNEDVAEMVKGKPLTFGSPVMYTQTKNVIGEIQGTTYPTSEKFTVFAVEHNGDFAGWEAANIVKNEDGTGYFPATGETVTNNGNHWYTANSYYLPQETEHKLSFAAYSPARAAGNGSINYGENGLLITEWTMPNTDHYDLMYSERTINVTESPVPIKFYHALASLRFKFVKATAVEGGPYSVIINKVQLLTGSNFNNVGTFETRTTTNNIIGSPRWSELKNVSSPASFQLISDSYEVTTTSSEIANIRSFLPIPQNVTSDMKLALDYSIVQAEGETAHKVHLEIPLTHFLLAGSTEHTTAWEMGKRYVYHVHFGALTKIAFAPSIGSDWVTVENAGTYTIK